MGYIRILWNLLKNFLMGLRILFFILFLVFIGVLYWEFFREPKVKPDTVLVINMEGSILDMPPMDPFTTRLAGEDIQTLQGILNNLKKATIDKRIIGILLNIKRFHAKFTTTQEIREALIKFKESGKKVFAYLEDIGMRSYFLVSPADKIYLSPSGETFLGGIRVEIPFYRKMLDKIGITPEFVYIGKYKTAPQSFIRDSMSEDHREVMNDLLDDFYNGYVEQIAAARGVPISRVKEWIDNGLYTAYESLLAGIVNELVYESQLDEKLRRELGLPEEADSQVEKEETVWEKWLTRWRITEKKTPLNKLNNTQYARVSVKAPGLHEEGEKVAIIYAQGIIVSGRSVNALGGSNQIGSDTLVKLIKNLVEDKKIKGILLRVDSSGGSSQASDIIWNSIQEARQKKPVVVSMADVAASGAYYISVPADCIVAYPLTITGSIGIFGGKFSTKGLYDLIGLNIETLQRGKNAGMFTSVRTFTEEERERFRHNVQAGYDEFISKVSQGRRMPLEVVDAVAQGRIWTGKRAVELGLIDRLGGIETAIEILKEKIGIPKEKDITLVAYPKIENPFQILLKRLRETRINTKLPDSILELQQELEELAALENEHFFAWWPYRIYLE
ncbi:MAG TPA: signal peptide peptidase SppA [Candidatus Limnocylindrales bacterium]|nr:signal peptide peptidase SppA [Candidatus Limnocylindrales bacterium]